MRPPFDICSRKFSMEPGKLPGNDRTATPLSLPAEGAAVEHREKLGGFPQWNLKVYATAQRVVNPRSDKRRTEAARPAS
jgi:hypothetical protein